MNCLGISLLQGQGVPRNVTTGMLLFEKAAKAGTQAVFLFFFTSDYSRLYRLSTKCHDLYQAFDRGASYSSRYTESNGSCKNFLPRYTLTDGIHE